MPTETAPHIVKSDAGGLSPRVKTNAEEAVKAHLLWDELTVPSGADDYLITLEFQSEKEFWLSGVSNDNERTHWKEFLPKRLESARLARLILEEKARAAGIEIDKTYQDPAIKALSR